MIHAYAIEPECVVQWCKRRAFKMVSRSFGLGTPRMLLELPKFTKWRKAVIDLGDAFIDADSKRPLSDLDKTRLLELAKLLGELTVRREGRQHDGARPWLENAEAEYARWPFAAIIAMTNPRANGAVLLESAVDDERNALWDRPTAATPPRTAEGIATVVSSLIENCDQLHLVDPHFDPQRYNYREVLARVVEMRADRWSSKTRDLWVHIKDDDSKRSRAELEAILSSMKALIPTNVIVKFKRWRERPRGEKLHNRYILTNLGGVVFGVGLDAGDEGQTDDVNLMDAQQFKKRWGQFNESVAFDFIDEKPIEIVGNKIRARTA